MCDVAGGDHGLKPPGGAAGAAAADAHIASALQRFLARMGAMDTRPEGVQRGPGKRGQAARTPERAPGAAGEPGPRRRAAPEERRGASGERGGGGGSSKRGAGSSKHSGGGGGKRGGRSSSQGDTGTTRADAGSSEGRSGGAAGAAGCRKPGEAGEQGVAAELAPAPAAPKRRRRA